MKKIGIVVPIFNAEPYLEKCINSILSQSYIDLEVMLVDDGSTDKSGYICDQFEKKDSRIHVIHQTNKGKLLARYNGVKELDCEYATFVDADDWIDSNTYKKMESYLEEGIDVISFQIIRYFDESRQFVSNNTYQTGIYNRKEIRDIIFPTMIWDDTRRTCGLDPSLANKIIKKKLLEQALFNAKHLDISYGDDVAVIYPLMLQAQTIGISGESLYYHRRRRGTDIAPYFADSGFYRKLSDLYDYLQRIFEGEYSFIKQLDYFYELSVRTYLKKHGNKKEYIRYLFPFDRIPSGKKIILYGASVVGQTYYEQIKRIHYGEIVAWVDKAYLLYQKLGVETVEVIRKIEGYDYIVIAIEAYSTVEKVKHNLMEMGVEEAKIIWSI